MAKPTEGRREGSLEAPKRNPLEWRESAFYDETNLFRELERVFDICHGCRRCFSLCNAFPTLFDAERQRVGRRPRAWLVRVAPRCSRPRVP